MITEQGSAIEATGIGVRNDALDNGQWKCQWLLTKYDKSGLIEGTEAGAGNLLMSAGVTSLFTLLTGGAGTVFNAANSYIGVGDSATASAATQTDLQATSNKTRVVMDTGFPKVGVAGGLLANQVQFQATFNTSTANYVWNEFGVFNASTAGTMLNRAVSALGTKATGSWTLQVLISIS